MNKRWLAYMKWGTGMLLLRLNKKSILIVRLKIQVEKEKQSVSLSTLNMAHWNCNFFCSKNEYK